MKIIDTFVLANIIVLIKRSISKSLNISLQEYPITILTGPRQSGKTTLLKSLSGYRYISLEDPDIRSFAETDARGFLEEYDQYVIMDEVQNVPSLFSYIQGIVDSRQEMGQYILSGSQNFNLMEHVTQSLAGRADVLRLLPLDIHELNSVDMLPTGADRYCTLGSYPAVYDRQLNADRYYANYIKTCVNRDVTQLINIQDQSAFKRCLRICASRAGQLINYNDMARDVGVSHTTMRNWLSILETSYIVYFLPPYFNNFGKRMIKSPKLYFYDTGLLCHLLGIRKSSIDFKHPYWGHIFENMIVTEYHKISAHRHEDREFWFWRDSKGHEVDLCHQDDRGQLHAIEIKASSTIKTEFFKGLNYFKKISGLDDLGRTLVYSGLQDQKRTEVMVKSWKSIGILS